MNVALRRALRQDAVLRLVPNPPYAMTATPDTDPAPPIPWADPARHTAFDRWLGGLRDDFSVDPASLQLASADASFRRYFRLQGQRGGQPCSFVVMDAPPPLEDVRPFVRVARRLGEAGLHVPEILDASESDGFLLLSDLGNQLYLQALQAAPREQADALMRDALAAWLKLQQSSPVGLPAYDEALLRRELELFPAWCVEREFGLVWSEAQRTTWERVSRLLIDSALAQPIVTVHRDFMPRNLMVTAERNPGVLDFQDAVAGPVTYDLASLLRDAFVSWDEEREIDWAVRGWDAARKAGVPVADDFGEFWRQVEWMGLQRHLKVLGIFCRLKHRDGKPAYAQDLPRFFAYATKVAMRYRELSPLLTLLEPMSGTAVSAGFTF